MYDHGLTSFDLARLRDDQMAGRPMMTPGLVWDTRFRDLELRPQVIGQDTRLEPGSTSGASGEGAPPTPSLSTIPGLQSTYKAMAERYRSFHPSTMTASDQLAALIVTTGDCVEISLQATVFRHPIYECCQANRSSQMSPPMW